VFGSGIALKDVKVLKQLIYVDSLRGHHSTGIAAVDFGGNIETYKKAVDGPDFLQLDKTQEILDGGVMSAILFAHNRYATKGGVSTKTAHPFTRGDITLCHNGTLTSQYYMPQATQFAVDSECIANAFDVEGAEKTIPTLRGAFALTWYDEAKKTFNIVRNDERTLCFANNKDRKVTYYASERKMLEAILHRNDITNVDYIELAAGKLVTVSLKDGSITLPSVKDVTTQGSEWNYGSGGHYSGYYSQGRSKTLKDGKGGSSLPLTPLEKWGLKVGERIEFYSTGVTPYATQGDKGVLEGVMTEGLCLDVKSYSLDSRSLAGFYTGCVTSGTIINGQQYVTVTDVRLKEIIEDDVNNLGLEKEVEALMEKKLRA
jgi:predicted glutamine amidotransferase